MVVAYAPGGTTDLIARLVAEKLDPALIKREEALGITVVADDRLSPAGHQKFFDAEVNRWTKSIKDAGI